MYVERNIESDILKNIKNDYILLILGARQTGKTTILKRIFKDLEDQYICSFINLENIEYKRLLNEHPKNLNKIIQQNSTRKKHIVFIDEIQYLKDPSNFLKFHYDENKESIKLIVAGSSAFYINKKFKDSLTGRKKIFYLRTLNFIEFLRFKNENKILNIVLSDKSIPFLFKDKLEQLFMEYIIFGAYPRVVLENDYKEKKDILENMSFDYIKKDIFDANIQNEEKYFDLFKILAHQCGQLVNLNELANCLNLSQPTIEKYLYVMQKSFHIALIKPFYKNIRKELTKMKKVYFYDLGLRNQLVSNFDNIEIREDKGMLLENIFFREVLFKEKLDNIKYWRTINKNEVDFIINEKEAFEIKFSEKNIKKTKYKIFQKNFPNIVLKFITFEKISNFMFRK